MIRNCTLKEAGISVCCFENTSYGARQSVLQRASSPYSARVHTMHASPCGHVLFRVIEWKTGGKIESRVKHATRAYCVVYVR